MKQANFVRGRKGEKMAANYLVGKGYRILSQNYHTRYGEIDIVCTDGVCLIFVEVKLKIGETFGSPEEMVSWTKVRQVERTAQSYNLENPKLAKLYPMQRIDVVAIVADENMKPDRITHYENVGAEV